jgi:hypothetical protein
MIVCAALLKTLAKDKTAYLLIVADIAEAVIVERSLN